MSLLVVFEDPGWRAFEIVAALRGVFDLRCGGRTLLERIQVQVAGRDLVLLARPELQALVREAHAGARSGTEGLAGSGPADAVFVNARLLALGRDLERALAGPESGFARLQGECLVLARCKPPAATRLAAELAGRVGKPETEPLGAWLRRELPELALSEWKPAGTTAGSVLLEHVWDLVHHNGPAIIDDFRKGPGAGVDDGALLYPGVHLVQDGAIRIARGCRIKPGTVLDAEDGPITLEEGVEVQPNVVVRGPAHVGPQSVLKAGAKVHEGTSIGPVCKIGGEVEESVVQGWSNKQHEGYLGHAWLGEWVNLGADTNNSDLKNNYSPVRAWEAGRSVDTGLLFVGLLAGDHVKSAINTQFNTGTVVGLASQVFGSGFPPKFVPPFSWGGGEGLALYDGARALETARAVMRRRKVEMTQAYERAFRAAYEAWRDHPRDAGES